LHTTAFVKAFAENNFSARTLTLKSSPAEVESDRKEYSRKVFSKITSERL